VTSYEVGPEALLEPLKGGVAGPAVVAIGGGTGLAQALRAIATYAGRISAVVTVADDGGSSGRLVQGLEIPPPGDIRQCLIALTPKDSVWRRLFDYRFEGADVRGHSLGNLIIASLADLEGDFETALRAAERLLGSIGSVIPASPERLHLEATIDGAIVHGQAAITEARGAISSIRLIPDAVASESAVAAITAADQIVLGPGSLYTSVIATLAVPGISEAVNRSAARLVYVANLITQDGETLGMDGADHLEALLALTGVRPPGAVVANRSEVLVAPPVEPVPVDPEVLATYGADVEFAELLDPAVEWPRHDSIRLGAALERLASADPS
jgi:uncharacterized cofD-like protein